METVPEPQVDGSVLSWAASATRAINARAIGREASPGARNERDRRDVQPRPFEVRFDASLDSGNGGWKIYLPTSHLLLFDGEYVAVTGGVTAISATPGWYEFTGIGLSDTHVWLVVTTAASQGSTTTTAAFAASAGTASGSAKVVNVCIAEVSYTEATSSTPASVAIHQSIVGALTLANVISVAPDTIVGMSLDYVPATGDPDSSEHAYSIRLKRGYLTISNGVLAITPDASLSQFVPTVPYTNQYNMNPS